MSSSIPASSSPAAIYREAKEAVKSGDRHNATIQRWRTKLAELAIKWEEEGEISEADREDLVYLASKEDVAKFRPVLYVIRKDLIGPERLIRVPPESRAGLGWEYQIHDLRGSEFEVLEY